MKKGRIKLNLKLKSASPLESSTMINQTFLFFASAALLTSPLLGTGLGLIFGIVVGAYEGLIHRSIKASLKVVWNITVWANIYAIVYGLGTAIIAYLLLYGFSLRPITSNYLDYGDNGIEILAPFFLLPSIFASLIGALIGSNTGITKSSNHLWQHRSRR